MDKHQAHYFLMAQAEMVRVEGMKAFNQNRQDRGEAQGYDEDAFLEAAKRIEELASMMVNS